MPADTFELERQQEEKGWWQSCEKTAELKTSKQTVRFIFCFSDFS